MTVIKLIGSRRRRCLCNYYGIWLRWMFSMLILLMVWANFILFSHELKNKFDGTVKNEYLNNKTIHIFCSYMNRIILHSYIW